MSSVGYDAVVVGSGPNGLSAASTLLRAGCSVLLVEGRDRVGGGLHTERSTLPGYLHDSCASVLPLAMASPVFRSLPLREHGLEWVFPEVPLAHPLEDDEPVVLWRDLDETAIGLERSMSSNVRPLSGGARRLGGDAERYRRLLGYLSRRQDDLIGDLLGPLRFPRHPLAAATFGLRALLPATSLARLLFRGRRARALFAGLAAHSLLPLERPGTSAFGLMLAMLGHTTGWPFVKGGAEELAKALASYVTSLDGRIETGRWVETIDELPPARLLFLDVTPRQLLRLAGHRLDPGYRRRLERYRYGPGVCKVDYALSEPIPWLSPACSRAGTVHLGGSLAEIAAGERSVWRGEHPERPFVLLSQPSLFDPARAPAGRHTAWAYCHVPNGSTVDMSGAIERRIERFAPGFAGIVLERRVSTARELEAHNPNLIGGDINGGVQDLGQMFARPTLRPVPYATSDPAIFLCSSSTPPGGGVHGLCGFHAARAALREVER